MKQSTVFILLHIAVVVFHKVVNSQSQPQCPRPIGTNVETQFTAARDRRFYLNTDHPAPCSGTIDRFRYCYYQPNGTIESSYRYHAVVAVYRRITDNNGSVYYQRISSSFNINRSGNQVRGIQDNYDCRNMDVNNFDIEAGDVVGVCIFDPNNVNRERRQLDVVGEARDYSLMQMNDVSGCERRTLPSSVLESQLSVINSRILHLYATIIDVTYIPTDPPTTTPSTTEPTTTAVTWTTIQDINDTTVSSTTSSIGLTTETTTEPVSTAATDSTSMPSETEATTTLAATTTELVSTAVTSIPPQTQATTLATVAATSELVSTTASMSPATTTVATSDPTTSDEPTTTSAAPIMTSEHSTASVSDGKVEAQASGGLEIEGIAGISIVAALTVVVTLALIVIAVIVSKKRGHKSRQYSPSAGAGQLDNSVQVLTGNGVDNLTYDTVSGFVNPGASLDTSYSMYDQVTKTDDTPTGEGNYCMLEESTFSNTYESVSADMYSEIKKPVVQVNHSHDHIIGGSYFENENIYSSPEESNGSLSYLLERNKQEDIYGNLDAYHAPASDEYEIYSQLTTCGVVNISHNHVTITGHLGSGQFGNVERGTWQSNKGVEVALKTLKEGSSELDKVKFLQEAAIMAQFRHPNIVTLHGVVSDKEPIMLVVEMMHGGDLREFLNSIRPDPGELPRADLAEMLLNFSQHVAFGMQYLSGKGFVHRDLAARNILVSNHNICKVADFGMSRDLDDENYYISRGGKVPVKWTAPEAIHYKKYSTASDVWSYGCLLYEIWSLGHKPFEGSTNIEVVKLIDSNKRLPPPPGCPRTVYELMIRCWHPATGSRPRFRDLTIVLTGDRSDVLSIPQEALSTHKLAGVLAAALEVGKDMYTDLQNRYITSE